MCTWMNEVAPDIIIVERAEIIKYNFFEDIISFWNTVNLLAVLMVVWCLVPDLH